MRFFSNLVLIVLLLTSVMAGAMSPASDPIGGPALGFSPNSDGSIVWPIIGIPGASLLGRRLSLGTEIQGAIISPRQDYMIANRVADGQPIIIRLASEPYEASLLTGTRHGQTVIGISPAGLAAALFDRDSKVLQVLRGVPATPEVAFEFDASTISGSGNLTALAVSDDASIALLGFSDSGNNSLWVVNASGSRFLSSSHASSIAFIVNTHDAVVSDAIVGEAYLLRGADDIPALMLLVSPSDGVNGLSGVAVSDNGRYVVVAGSASGTIGIVDLERSTHAVVTCKCTPSGVYRMNGTAVFRLNEPPDALVTILDLSSGTPRILIIPPERKAAGSGSDIAR